MSPLDLIRGDDGKMVLTKLAASTFHFVITLTVITVTAARIYKFVIGEAATGNEMLFELGMWGLYAASSVGHAVADKTGAQVNAFKNRQLDVEATPVVPVASTVTETKITEVKTA